MSLRISREEWINRATIELSLGNKVSIDFWGTLCILKKTPENIRLIVCEKLLSEFNLTGSSSDFLELYNRVSQGLRLISKAIYNESEYKASDCWYVLGVILFKSKDKANEFRNRAMSIEFEIFCSHSKVPQKIAKWLGFMQDQNNLIIISDFEHDSIFLNNIMIFHNIDLKIEIITSSESMLSKYSGSIFEDFKVRPTLHIGDNFDSDFKRAVKAGINSILTKKSISFRIVSGAQKIGFFSQKTLFKIGVILTIPFSMTRYVNCLLKLNIYWKSQVSKLMKNANVIVFVGSEGAFISQQFSSFELSQGSNTTYLCTNFGRGKILSAALQVNPVYVFSKLLLENWSFMKICDFLGVANPNASILKGTKNINEIIDYLISAMVLSDVARENYLDIMSIFENKLDKILIVDIGYQGSFADGLQALGFKNILVAQMLGKYSTSSTFNSNHAALGIKVRESIFDRTHPTLDTDLVESFFSLGPRGVQLDNNLVKMQDFVVKASLRRHKSETFSNLKLQKILLFPPRDFVKSLSKSVFHRDDLSNNFVHLENLPWSGNVEIRRLFWHMYLLKSYLLRLWH